MRFYTSESTIVGVLKIKGELQTVAIRNESKQSRCFHPMKAKRRQKVSLDLGSLLGGLAHFKIT